MEYGLTEPDLELIQNTFTKFPEIKSVHLFGSRAIGNYKKASDVDLAILGNLSAAILGRLKTTL